MEMDTSYDIRVVWKSVIHLLLDSYNDLISALVVDIYHSQNGRKFGEFCDILKIKKICFRSFYL